MIGAIPVQRQTLPARASPISAAVGSAEANKRLLASHPLVQEGHKIVPSITRVFRRDQNLYVYFEVYDPELDETRKLPSVAAEPLRRQRVREDELRAVDHVRAQPALPELPPGDG